MNITSIFFIAQTLHSSFNSQKAGSSQRPSVPRTLGGGRESIDKLFKPTMNCACEDELSRCRKKSLLAAASEQVLNSSASSTPIISNCVSQKAPPPIKLTEQSPLNDDKREVATRRYSLLPKSTKTNGLSSRINSSKEKNFPPTISSRQQQQQHSGSRIARFSSLKAEPISIPAPVSSTLPPTQTPLVLTASSGSRTATTQSSTSTIGDEVAAGDVSVDLTNNDDRTDSNANELLPWWTASSTEVIYTWIQLLRMLIKRAFQTGYFQESRQHFLTYILNFPSSTSASLGALVRTRPAASTDKEETGDGRVHGIPNYGQTCFLNSVLQSLASLEPFVAYLERIVQLDHEKQKIEREFSSWDQVLDGNHPLLSKPPCLSERTLKIINAVNGLYKFKGGNFIDPRDVLSAVAEQHAQFRSLGNEQQDAQEFLQAVLDTVVEDAQLSAVSSAVRPAFLTSFLAPSNKQQEEPPSNDDCNVLEEILTAGLVSRERRQYQRRQKENCTQLPSIVLVDEKKSNDNAGSSNCVAAEHSVVAPSAENSTNNTLANGSSSPVSLNQCEEKKQEDVELQNPKVCSGRTAFLDESTISINKTSGEDNRFLHHDIAAKERDLSAAMQIMMTTTSSTTPSPFCGWMGSALQCAKCKHVRPIQNAPFLNIPIIPTSVSSYLLTAHRGNPPRKNAVSGPPCALEECLAEFTSVERVKDVECRNCTLQREIANAQEEVEMLQGAVDAVLRRAKRNGATNDSGNDHAKHLRHELEQAQSRLHTLKNASPDDGDEKSSNGNFSLPSTSRNNDILPEVIAKPEVAIQKNDAFKRLLLTRMPSILCIHIQRRYYDPVSNNMSKTMQHVIFPEKLDLAPYCAYGGVHCSSSSGEASWSGTASNATHCDEKRKKTLIQYKLMSVIEHHGNAYFGHYVSYRRDPLTGGWLCVSDDTIRQVDWLDVQKCQAYMLFYEAI